MKLNEYLETVSEQIRYTKIRSTVTEELKNHILDQAADYEECGAFPEEALERAVREMGDPVETGVALDRIHRPQMNWAIMVAIAVLSLFGVGVFYIANTKFSDAFPWQQQAMYVLLGFLLMLFVYRLDYSIMEKFKWKAAVSFFLLMVVSSMLFGVEIYGAARWISFGPISFSISEAMLLYVPLFGAALYSFRGDGYIILVKIFPMIVLPAFFVWTRPDLSAALILFTSLFCLFAFAVWKDWYQIHKKAVLGICGGIVLLTPLSILGYFYFFGAAYQTERIRSFFTQNGDANYIYTIARNIRESSALLGSSERAMEQFSNGPTRELTDFILVSMCSIYGVLLTVAIVAGLTLIIFKIFRISLTQKNQLGMIVGTGCGLVFLVKTSVGLLQNLQLIPYTSVSMPFLSYGGSNVVVSYILLGLVLSVYRYKNILPDEKAVPVKHRRRLKITWE